MRCHGSGARANDQIGVQDERVAHTGPTRDKRVEQHPHRRSAQGVRGQSDGGQPGCDHLREGGVVDTDDAEFVGHPHAAVEQPVDDADGHLVVVGQHGRGAAREDEVGGTDPRGEPGVERPEFGGLHPEPRAGFPVAAQAEPVGVATGRACEVDDPPVSQRMQVLDGVRHRLRGVHHDRGDALEQAVDHHDGHRRVQLAQRRVGHQRRDEQQAVDLGRQRLRPPLLVVGLLVGARDEQGRALAARLLLHGLGDHTGEGVRDVGNDDADRAGAAAGQRAGDGMRGVAHVLGDRHHPLPGVDGHGVGLGEHARHGGGRHPGAGSHFADRHRSSSVATSMKPVSETVKANRADETEATAPTRDPRAGVPSWTG